MAVRTRHNAQSRPLKDGHPRRRIRRSLVLNLAAITVAGSGLIVLAGADEGFAQSTSTPSAQIRSIDSTKSGSTIVSLSLPDDVPKNAKVGVGTESPSTAAIEADPKSLDLMMVIDSSKQTGNRQLQAFKDEVNTFAPGSNGVKRLGVVASGGKAYIPVELTSDATVIETDISPVSVSPLGTSSVYDAIVLAAKRLTDSDARHEIVILHASPDSGEGADANTVRRALRETRSRLNVVDLAPNTVDGQALASMVSEFGGTYSPATAASVGTVLDGIAAMTKGRYVLEFPTPEGVDRTNVSVQLSSGETLRASFQPGGIVDTPTALAPLTPSGSGWADMFDTSIVKWAVALLALLAAGGIAWAALNIAIKDKDSVRARLEAYTIGATPEVAADDSMLGSSELLKRAVAKSGEFAERRGMADKIDLLLEQADVKLHSGEIVFLMILSPIVLALVAFAATGTPFIALVGGVIGAVLPKAILEFRAKRRVRQFEAQLPDALQLLAGTLRAGFSISQAITAVSEDLDEPIGQELRRCVAEMQLGRQLEDALDGAAERLKSKDFAWTVLAIRIQREVGGNLAELLMTVSDTMVQRQRLMRDVRGLTAEGRMSAVVLGCLPLGLIGFLALSNPGYLAPLRHGGGLVIAGISAVVMVLGFFWMNKIIKIEV